MLAFVAWTTAVACVAASFVQWRHTGQSYLGSPREALKLIARREGLARGSRAAADRAWRFVGEVLAAAPGRARIATLNESLLVIERLTEDVAAVPRAGARIALFTGFGCAVLAIARMPSTRTSEAALWSACAGMAGALICTCLGGSARRAAREARHGYSELANRLMMTNRLE